MIIISDNAAIEKNLHFLQDTIESHGGFLDADLVIRCENGALSIEKMGPVNHGKPLIAVPGELLLPAEKMGLGVKNDELFCTPEKGILSDIQYKLSETMIEIYNLTGKIKAHRASCCWFAMHDTTDALEKLLTARTLDDTQQQLLAFAKDSHKQKRDDYNQVLCDTYIKTRSIVHKKKHDDGEDIIQFADKIMPIIDFFNHHSEGAPYNFDTGYDTTATDREFLQIRDKRPMSFSNECFAFYNRMDALDSYVGYGFPDIHAPYVRSVPCTIEIPGTVKIVVHSIAFSRHKSTLPKNNTGLQFYIPGTVKSDEDTLEITHLFIPTSKAAPNALRRVLQLLITNRSAFVRTLSTREIRECVLEAENKIIDENIRFYQNLVADLADRARAEIGSARTIQDIATLQLNKLYKYQFDENQFAADNTEADKITAAE